MEHNCFETVAGARYFFTLATHRRRPLLSLGDGLFTLRRALADVMEQQPFTLDALVVLPDHLHCIWSLPPGDTDFDGRWYTIKSQFSRQYRQTGRLRAVQIWETQVRARQLRSDAEFHEHLDRVQFDPVKHGYVAAPIDWLPSSFLQFVEQGWYPEDWRQHEAGEAEPPQYGPTAGTAPGRAPIITA